MGRFDESADRSAKKVDQKFEKELADLQMPTKETLERLFPPGVDRDNLKNLLGVVKSSTSEMDAFFKIRDNAQTLGVAAIKLAKTFLIV